MTTLAIAPARRTQVALMFVIPLVVIGFATLVYYTGIGVPRATSNRGELVQPPPNIDAVALRETGGAPWRHAGAARDWSMLVVASGECAQDCRERVHLTRQVRTALGRDAPRVARLLVGTGGAVDAALVAALHGEHGDLLALRADDEAAFERLLDRAPAAPVGVYLVDPRGFVMMRYDAIHGGREMLGDLRFLLRHSAPPAR